MERQLRSLRLLARAQSAIMEEQGKRYGRQAAFFAAAGLFALFALAMLNVAAFFALLPRFGPAYAALAVTGGDLVLAAIFGFTGIKVAESAEVQSAREARDLALADIEATIQSAGSSVNEMKQVLTGTAAGVASSVLSSVVGKFTRRRRRRRKDSGDDAPAPDARGPDPENN